MGLTFQTYGVGGITLDQQVDEIAVVLATMEELRQRLHDMVGELEPWDTLPERLQAAEEISRELDGLIVHYMQLQQQQKPA